ncbi:endocytosis regulator [Schizosaccharomyces octosporus yFS286]|uniref:Endocytosis regulator n=1 Tax=Schizosaccharomyces octosporus (strain yFS286) TaxID=483514 RepID=S9Q2V2_SCHOY|nr:endocytosis regulator [Schizosaccharomyces octosporus yFS286]EPX74023.1 endocytosis regulator [Schizosaccharomyces octosporus yFS286]
MPLKLSLPRSSSHARESHCQMDVRMESPPLVLLGPPETSTGALASGIFKLTILHQPFVHVHSLKLQLKQKISVYHPPVSHCYECGGSTEVLQEWLFISNTKFPSGTHHWPFSWLFPGTLPATLSTRHIGVEYYLEATFCYATSDGGLSPYKPEIMKYPLELKRAFVPGSDTIHKRIFPPTDLVANITMSSILHPHTVALMEITMTGFLQADGSEWGVTRVTWRLEEHLNYTPRPCDRHKDTVRFRTVQEKKILSAQDLQSGWKFVDHQFFLTCQINAAAFREPTCDAELSGRFNLKISHFLIIEAIVNRRKGATSNMGNARILRVSIPQPLTSPAGLGISWDEECPPVFESVGPAPPAYC